MIRWQAGRQGTGYQKLAIVKGPFFDVWLIRYPKGAHLPEHKDPLTPDAWLKAPLWWEPKHFRLNVVLRHAKKGGHFVCERAIFRTRHIALFRPDKVAHSVTKILRGTRYVLSFGVGI